METIYDPNLFLQVPKRAHRLSQQKGVWCYTIRTNTAIEDMVMICDLELCYWLDEDCSYIDNSSGMGS